MGLAVGLTFGILILIATLVALAIGGYFCFSRYKKRSQSNNVTSTNTARRASSTDDDYTTSPPLATDFLIKPNVMGVGPPPQPAIPEEAPPSYTAALGAPPFQIVVSVIIIRNPLIKDTSNEDIFLSLSSGG